MLEWIVIVGLVIAMYIIIYKYEKKMDKLEQKVHENHSKIEANKNKLDEHHDRISTNHSRLDEHNNHIEQMWVTIPKKEKKDS